MVKLVHVLTLVYYCWSSLHVCRSDDEDGQTSTTLAYVTRAPLVILTKSNNVTGRSNFRRTFAVPLGSDTTRPVSSSTIRSSTSTSTPSTSSSSTSTTSRPTSSSSSRTTSSASTSTSTTTTSTTASTSASTSASRSTTTKSHPSSTSTSTSTVSYATSALPLIDTTRVGESDDDIDFELQARPLPTAPSRKLRLSFRPSAKYERYIVNCTDLDTDSALAASYPMDSNRLTIDGLLPGHAYAVNLYGHAAGQRRKASESVRLAQVTANMLPETPSIDSQSVKISTNSISIAGEKTPGNLQDYFLLTYTQLDAVTPSKSVINVSDIQEQSRVDFYLGSLRAGSTYNVSISAHRRNQSSLSWMSMLSTVPLPPNDVRLTGSDANQISLAWDIPTNSGYDFFNIVYGSESRTNASEKATRDASFKLQDGIVPGEIYYFHIYAVKDRDVYSEASYLEVSTKPLPPISLSITPNYVAKRFDVVARLNSEQLSRQDSCLLQYISEEEVDAGEVRPVNATTPAKNEMCLWQLSLVPGRTYQFHAWTMRHEKFSDLFANSTTIEPAFDAQRFVIDVVQEETALNVKWNSQATSEYWPTLVGDQGTLSASLLPSYQATKMSNPMTSLNNQLSFVNLTSGACYQLEVYTTAAGIVSKNRTRFRRRLEPVSVSFSTVNETDTTITVVVKVDWPASGVDASCRVLVTVRDDENHTTVNKTLSGSGTDGLYAIQVTNLKPFSKYQVFGTHICGESNSECPQSIRSLRPFFFETAQGVPAAVRFVRVIVQSPFSATVQWMKPDQLNGVVNQYVVTVYPESTNGELSWNVTVPSSETSYQFNNLTGGTKYSFDVRAQTAAGIGQSSAMEISSKELTSAKTPLWNPPKPFGRPEIMYNTVHETDFSVRFNYSMFSTRHGLLTEYSIIVVEADDHRENVGEANNDVQTWYDVQALNVWTPYVAVLKRLPPTKSFDSAAVVEVIGVDLDCPKNGLKTPSVQRSQSDGSTPKQYCNGPLRAGRRYRAKIRVYASPQLFSDSDYSEIVITSSESGGGGSGAVVAAVVAFAAVLAGVVGLLLLLRRRGIDPIRSCVKSNASCFLLTPGGDSVDAATVGVAGVGAAGNGVGGGVARRQRSLRERANIDGRLDKLNQTHHQHVQPPHTIISTANFEFSRPVAKSDFAEHVRLMSADSDLRFSEEYEDLKQVGRNQACTAADLPCNRNKNRFTNILPYDYNRVKLASVDDEEGSDYVNASYISGYNSPREYIAAQGPLPSTRDDFWRMVWEQNCPAIVNLTRCFEKGREKCDQYWPSDTDPICYGEIDVLLLNETRFPDWTIREFKLTHSGQSRTVRHLHFTAWPDFGVPERPQTLVKFVRALRARVPNDAGPIIVHCSAGVGRSGTLIAIDRILLHMQNHDYVDVFSVVCEMRKERVWMVQTEQQYICIHQCLLCVLDGKENDDSPFLLSRPAVPAVEIHQNPAFEDDEGIAESGV